MKHHIDTKTGIRVSEYITEGVYTFCQHDVDNINQHMEILAYGDGWYLRINGGAWLCEALKSRDELIAEMQDMSDTMDLCKYAPAFRAAINWAEDRAPFWKSSKCRVFHKAGELTLIPS